MPTAPSKLRFLPAARDDIESIANHNSDHASRVLTKIADWEEKIQWGRVPQEHLTYLSGTGEHNFYRERIGNSGYRVIYEIDDDTMTVVAVLPKGDDTYDLGALRRRLDE